MKMDLGLQVKFSQSLIMTPQLQQAIKLLQLSRYELEQLIDQSLVENPTLESLSASDDAESAGDAQSESNDTLGDVSEESYLEGTVSDNDSDVSPEFKEWEDYIEETGSYNENISKNSGSASENDPQNILENTLTGKESLASYLIWQSELTLESDDEKKISKAIISYIDNDGYLTASIREIISLHLFIQNWCKFNAEKRNEPFTREDIERFDSKYHKETGNRRTNLAKKLIKNVRFNNDQDDAPTEERDDEQKSAPSVISDDDCFAVEKILRKIQQFDPNGVGARNIRECLLIQLEAMSMQDTFPYKIVHNDFQNLIRNDIHKLNKKYHVTFEEVQVACRVVRELEPKPGRPFSEDDTQYVIPDVFIYKRLGRYTVQLNKETLPRLRISPQYLKLAKEQHIANLQKKKNQDGEEDLTEAYLNEKIRAGEWLIKSIDQRQRTIYKVAESILKNQKSFFEGGISKLKPMILKVVAEDIGVHESTVSRVTNNKFVHTPQGIFELKYFFTSGVVQDDGGAISSKKIKDLISRLIQSENVKKPYTDHQLAIELEKAEKIKIARRTVAKYRESMNILPSSRRKRLF